MDDGSSAGTGAGIDASIDASIEDATVPAVVLTGFMGTGKTTVGRRLADRLGWEFVDTDAQIESRHGPIAEIFRRSGESDFRRYERDLAGELAHRSRIVVATGGRMMLDPVNAEHFADAAVFCLTADVATIAGRVLADGPADRPMLSDGDGAGDGDLAGRIAGLLAERAAGYGRFAQVETAGRRPDAIVDEIVARLNPARGG